MAAPSNSPADRPTEWITAIVGLLTAVIAFTTNHDQLALVSAVGGVLPTLVTLYQETFGKVSKTTP